MVEELSIVGQRKPDISGIAKVTGAAKFVSDIHLPNTLIGKVLHSPYAHARIVEIDTSVAEQLPGVESIITHKDVLQKQYTGTLMNLQSYSGIEMWGAYDRRILDNTVRYVGDAVAAVAAVNEKVAEQALELISVKYEQLPVIFDELKATNSNAPKIHDFVQRRQSDGLPGKAPLKNNIGAHIDAFPVGDVEKGFQEADYIIERTGFTSPQRQAPLETFHCIASFDATGKLSIWTQIQLPHLMKRMIAYIFDIPVRNIRVIGKYIGGGFGAGLSLLREPICISLAMKTGKPVKLIYTRQEEFIDRPTRSCMGPYVFKMGVKNDGTITAIKKKIISAAGAHLECAALESLVAMGAGNALYRCPNFMAESDAIYTNKIPCGAMRGFGNPEETFIREQVIDEAAEKIDMDPLDFRLKNTCKVGDPGVFGPDFPLTNVEINDCIKIGAEKIGWQEKRYAKKEGLLRRGVGVSCMAHNSGAWPAHQEHSNAFIKFNEDASIVLIISPPPIGTNSFTSLAQVAAEVLGIPFEDVEVVWGDTDVTLFEIGSHASRTMYIVGQAVQQAAMKAKQKLFDRAANKLGTLADSLEIKDKRIYVKTNPEIGIMAAEITKEAIYSHVNVEQITGSCSFSPHNSPPPYQAVFTEVEVDIETGEVKILKMTVVNASGTLINPMIVEGQLEGGVAQGLGYALWEIPVTDKDSGQVLTDDFDTYKIAGTLDMPELEIVMVEKPEPTGPFGAKAVGEIGCVNQAASIANAIYNAVGIRVWELPITPEKILKAIKAK